MHQMILRAAQSGKLSAMRPVLESNELPPIVSFDSLLKPIEYWKKNSKNGDGKDILKHIELIKKLPFAILDKGREKERYVWPYLAEVSPKSLDKTQVKQMLSLVSKSELEAMRKSGKYLFYRSVIGRDGTWHMFARDEE